MRLSTDKDDPGYAATTHGVRVFFNGAEVRGVFTADEERRLIVQAVFDESGCFQLAPCRTKVLTEVRHGDVRIELPEPHHQAMADRKAHNAELTGPRRRAAP